MPFDRFRSLLFSKHQKIDAHPCSAATAASMMTPMTIYSPCSWSSMHDDFRCLRFLVWTGGAPGFTLTTSRGSERNCTAFASDEDAELRVDYVTERKVWEAGIRPGDVLETVSGKRVHTMDTEAALVLVQMAKSPSIIRFRSPACGKRVHFNVHLGRQKLGVVFSGDGSRGVPIVTRVDRRSQTFSGDFATPLGIRVGDVLVAVNGKDAITAGLNIITKYLETCPRPLTLTFERNANEGNWDNWVSSQSACEESEENPRRAHSLQSTASPAFSREIASLRCRTFLTPFIPARVSHSANPRLQQADHLQRSSKHHAEVLIKWVDGPLGLTLVEDDISGAVIVNRLTGKGSSASLERLRHGYQLYSINGEQLKSRTLDDLRRELLSVQKPVELVFRPPESEDSSEDDSSFENGSDPVSPDHLSGLDVGLNKCANRDLALASADQHSCSQQTTPQGEQSEYEVIWTAPQLGLQLEIPHPRATGEVSTRRSYPIVHHVIQPSTLGLPHDAIGHLFVAVNNWSTSGLSSTELRTLLRVAPRPAVLRFRTQEEVPTFQRTILSDFSCAKDDQVMHTNPTAFGSLYNIIWSNGKLGIRFASYEDANHRNAVVVYVKRIGPGQAQTLKLVAVGDILESINGHNLPPKQALKRTMRDLTRLKHPVTLGFRRLLVERSSE